MAKWINALAGARKLNLFPLVMVSWIMIVYMLATENLSWYLWVFVAIVIVERIWLQLGIWVATLLVKEMQRQIMETMSQMEDDDFPGLGMPPSPLPPSE